MASTASVITLDKVREAERNASRIVSLLLTAQEERAENLADYLGISRAAVYERLAGRRRFTVGELAVLADFFGVEPAIFFREPRSLFGDHAFGGSGRSSNGGGMDLEATISGPGVRNRAPGLLPCTFGQHRRSDGLNANAAFPPNLQRSSLFRAA